MKNIDLVNIVFTQFNKLGYKPYDIEHPDGYFLFEEDKDSVTHFRLKGHGIWKHWKFGLWVNSKYMSEEKIAEMQKKRENGEIKWGDEPKVIQLFAQYDTCIDKFKPSRSALCVEYDAEHIQNWQKGKYKAPFWEMENMLGMMCHHPFLCYEEFCGQYAGYYKGSFLWNFIKYESKYKWRKFSTKVQIAYLLPWTKFKCWLAAKDKCIDSLELIDFDKEYPNMSTSYLYNVRYFFTEEATSEQEVNWLNKWWHKDEYGKRGAYDCIVQVDLCHKVGHDGMYRYGFE